MDRFILPLAEGLDPQVHVNKHTISGWFTNHHLMAIVAAVLGLLLLTAAAFKMRRRPELGVAGYVTRGAYGGFFEVLLTYLRDEAVRPLLGKATDRYIGFLWSLFFFILIGNILGMMPIGQILAFATGDAHKAHWAGTFTGNWNFTIGLAALSALMCLVAGVVENGAGYFAHYWTIPLKGQPLWLWPLLILVGFGILLLEIAGNFVIKPFALSVRLLANMLAGHLVLGSLLIMAVTAGNFFGTGVSLFGALCISFMELFVAFLQAYIFMFLTTIFISMGAAHHGDDHGEAHAH